MSLTPEQQRRATQVTRESRERVIGKYCGCGRQAVKWVRGGFACARCLKIEDRLYGHDPFFTKEQSPKLNHHESSYEASPEHDSELE